MKVRTLGNSKLAVSALGYGCDVDKQTACQQVRDFIGGAGKSGQDVRKHFT